MNKSVTEQIGVVNTILDALNKKDTLNAEDIKKINNTLTSSLKSIETAIADFNKKFIHTEERQIEIVKIKIQY